ncbi:hypothetical protein MHU86_14708 [Fragilaria crotonensis]|nr:hypothetical protein MHU86_14708 [Fragilaria crotonensis]
MKRGPLPKFFDTLLKVLETHAEVCQVGDGKFLRRDMQHLIGGASNLGTKYEHQFMVNSVWRKVQKEYQHAVQQAASKITVEDAITQWTTQDNLNQWFDDAKADLLSTGMVVTNLSSMKMVVHQKVRFV